MAATQQDFEIWEGDSVPITFTVTNADGTPYNLTGAEAIVWAMSLRPSSAVLLEKTLGAGITITTPGSQGKFVVQLNPNDTIGLFGRYYHEAQVTDSGGNPRVVSIGTAYIKPSNIT